MRIATKEYNVYSIEDVKNNDELKNKVLEKNWDLNIDNSYWYEDIIFDWKEKLENYGFEDVKIYFSGFGLQGDGACFISKNINLSLLAKKLGFSTREISVIKALQEQSYIYSELTHNSRYYHEHSTDFTIYNGYMRATWKHIFKIVARLGLSVKNLIVELSKTIYIDLENHYEYLTSEDAILETLEANEYEFNEDGSIF